MFNDDKEKFKEIYLNEIRNTGKAEGIMHTTGKSGEKIQLLYKNFLVKSDMDMPYVIGFSTDITLRVKAERALKESEEKYRRII